jgi:glucose/arabinose dehydrogenase
MTTANLKRSFQSDAWLNGLAATLGILAVASCGGTKAANSGRETPEAGGGGDALVEAPIEALPDAEVIADAIAKSVSDAQTTAPNGTYCSLAGSVLWGAAGPTTVAGGPSGTPPLEWLTLPAGFCAHYFGTVGDARQLRFAPGGELFVASPTTGTTGGNYGQGAAAVVVLPDDNRDGFADPSITFLGNLPSTQGMLFANGFFYFQDDATVRRLAYKTGDRHPTSMPQAVTTLSLPPISAPQDPLHWPKALDIAMDGTMYVTNGGSQDDACISTNPTRGAIFAFQADGTTRLVAKGFRNPIALRCEANHDVCLAVELALDYSQDLGGREKLVVVRPGDDWGFPCCASRNLPYATATYGDTHVTPDCSNVAADTDSFVIGHTPFGVDFEQGMWPAPWKERAFVTLHGVVGSFVGARVVAIALDPTTGAPMPATELGDGGPKPDSLLQFASGWDDGRQDHGRPAAIAFAADGRMFLADDNLGIIVWIAPITLMASH